MKILVVHRQKEVTERIKSVLNDKAVIRYANSGLDGLLAARVEAFDLIICSTDLPMVTGFELVRSLRNSSVNKNTPVIFLADDFIDEKTEYLAHALGVSGMIAMEEVDQNLSDIVNENVKPKSSQKWMGLIPDKDRLN